MMKTAVIVSSKDLAGQNIKKHLISEQGFSKLEQKFKDEKVYSLNENIKLYTINTDTIHFENIDREIEADIFIFATRHRSESGIPSLSVHSPGNWGTSEYGGEEKKLCISPANILKKAFQTIEKNKIGGFDIVQECTHHGPYMEKPVMFIEIGSTEKEWVREDAGEAIAKSIVEIIFCIDNLENYRSAFGIGGLHTTPNFKKIQLSSDVAVGHVCPKYNLQNLGKEMILQALEKTVPKANLIIVDWKGLSEHKERIVEILNELGIEWKKTKDY
jgi:D-aminoacyl-tRNA deacylase